MKSLGLFLVALSFVLAGSAAWAEPPPAFLGAWGSEGAGFGELRCPTGVAFDSEGHVVVADSHNGRIQLFQTDGTPVEVLRRVGSDEPRMHHPQAVGVDAAGRLLVPDSEGDCVWVFDRGGLLLEDWGGTGSAPGQFKAPGSINSNPFGHVFVADWGNKRIQRLDDQGVCNFEWTPAVAGPFSVACDHRGHVYVADRMGDRVLKYDCSGHLLASWGTRGRAIGQFLTPHAIACDARGDVYVADTYNYRIQKFDAYGRFLTAWGSFGHGEGQFVKPAALAISGDGMVAVADEAIHRIQVFGTPALVKAFADILPAVCPNTIEAGSGGTMQVALLGTATFDVFDVDGATVRFASLAPALMGFGDLSQPPADLLDPCACATAGPDGYDDLILTYDVNAVRAALGTARTAAVTGALRDGTPFEAIGCIEMLESGPMTAATGSDRIAMRLEPRPGSIGVTWTLPAGANTRLTVHDIGGRVVGRLVDGWRPKGEYRTNWPLGEIGSGVYFLRLQGGDRVVVRRISVVR